MRPLNEAEETEIIRLLAERGHEADTARSGNAHGARVSAADRSDPHTSADLGLAAGREWMRAGNDGDDHLLEHVLNG